MLVTKYCYDLIEIVIQNLWLVHGHIGHVTDDFSILFVKIV